MVASLLQDMKRKKNGWIVCIIVGFGVPSRYVCVRVCVCHVCVHVSLTKGSSLSCVFLKLVWGRSSFRLFQQQHCPPEWQEHVSNVLDSGKAMDRVVFQEIHSGEIFGFDSFLTGAPAYSSIVVDSEKAVVSCVYPWFWAIYSCFALASFRPLLLLALFSRGAIAFIGMKKCYHVQRRNFGTFGFSSLEMGLKK